MPALARPTIILAFAAILQLVPVSSRAEPPTEADFKRADAELNRTYKETLNSINTSGTRDALIKSQRAWLAYRDAEAPFRAGLDSKNASAYSKDLLAAMTALTEQRTRDLANLGKQEAPSQEGGGKEATAATGPFLPEGWKPDLSDSATHLTDELGDAKVQSEINSLSRCLADTKDAALFIVYTQLYQKLDAAGRSALVHEQTQWLKDRSRKAAGAVESKGGSLAAFESNAAEEKLTEARTKQLAKRLEGKGRE